jgi:UDP-N-acetylmuramoyl-tripeptide--D-alanyl-D-alanine ligase
MTIPLWTADEILDATKGKCSRADWTVDGVAIDNRTIEAGDLFIAIKGPNDDGHAYVASAFANGATAALVSEIPENAADGGILVLVDDTQSAMEALGRASRARVDAQIIAVTGSVGKTGTKEALAVVLSDQGKTHWSVGSYNNHWGVPLSLARMPRDVEFAIFELGMNHSGELGPLSKMVEPHVAIITTIAAAHLEFFKDTSEIAAAKAEIFEGITRGGAALLNADSEHRELMKRFAREANLARVWHFGEAPDTEINLKNITLKPQSSDALVTIQGHIKQISLPVPGRHWVQNVLAVLGAVELVGGDVDKAVRALHLLKAPSGRGVQMTLECEGGSFVLVDESYNASPIAVQAALKVLGKMEMSKGGRKIAVLGDMRELGEKTTEIHASLANDLSENEIDMLYACGPNMKHLFNAVSPPRQAGYASSSDELVEDVLRTVQASDVVLIKGSLGSKMKVILDALIKQSEMLRAVKKAGA